MPADKQPPGDIPVAGEPVEEKMDIKSREAKIRSSAEYLKIQEAYLGNVKEKKGLSSKDFLDHLAKSAEKYGEGYLREAAFLFLKDKRHASAPLEEPKSGEKGKKVKKLSEKTEVVGKDADETKETHVLAAEAVRNVNPDTAMGQKLKEALEDSSLPPKDEQIQAIKAIKEEKVIETKKIQAEIMNKEEKKETTPPPTETPTALDIIIIKEARANAQRENAITYLTAGFLSPPVSGEKMEEELKRRLRERKNDKSYQALLDDFENTCKEMKSRINLFEVARQAKIDKEDSHHEGEKYKEKELGVIVIVIGVIDTNTEKKRCQILTRGRGDPSINIKVAVDFSKFPSEFYSEYLKRLQQPGQILKVNLEKIQSGHKGDKYFEAALAADFFVGVTSSEAQTVAEAAPAEKGAVTPLQSAEKTKSGEEEKVSKTTGVEVTEKPSVETLTTPPKEKEPQVQEQELKEKMQELQASFEATEAEWKKYQGLRGLFKFGQKEAVANINEEYEQAKDRYLRAKAEYIAFKTHNFLEDKSRLADGYYTVLAKSYEKKFGAEPRELLAKLYAGYKKLGDLNIARAFGFEERLAKWAPTTGAKKLSKFAANFLTRFLSARTALSFGLLGAGVYAGAGLTLGAGLLGARRGLAALGGGGGIYEFLKIKEKYKLEKEIEPAKLAKMSLEEIIERMRQIEVFNLLEGKESFESYGYNSLTAELESRLAQEAEKKEHSLKNKLADLSKTADQELDKALSKQVSADQRRQIAAVGVAAFLGSGLFGEMLKTIKENVWPPELVEAGAPIKGAASHDQEAVKRLAKTIPLEEKPPGPSATELLDQAKEAAHLQEITTLEKGKGIIHVLRAQLLDNPEKFGLPKNASFDQADRLATKIAMDEGYLKFKGDKIIEQWYRYDPNKPMQFILEKDSQGNFQVVEQGAAGRSFTHISERYPEAETAKVEAGEIQKEDSVLSEDRRSAVTEVKVGKISNVYGINDLKKIDIYNQQLTQKLRAVSELVKHYETMSAGQTDQTILESAQAVKKQVLDEIHQWEEIVAGGKSLNVYDNKIFDPEKTGPDYWKEFYKQNLENKIWKQAGTEITETAEPGAGIKKAAESIFNEVEKTESLSNQYTNSNLSFSSRLDALKQMLPEGEKLQYDAIRYWQDGGKVYFKFSNLEEAPVNEKTIGVLTEFHQLSAVQKADEGIIKKIVEDLSKILKKK